VASAIFLVVLGNSRALALPTLQLQLEYDYSIRSDFVTPAPYQLYDGVSYQPGTHDPTDIHVFSVFVKLDGVSVSPDESLRSLIFDVVLSPGLTPLSGAEWLTLLPSPIFDPPPPGPIGGGARPLILVNTDDGLNDLKSIRVEFDQLAAFGLDPGESASFEIGQIPLLWDGTVASFYLAPSPDVPIAWDTWFDGFRIPEYELGPFTRSINPDGYSDGFDFGIPEPSSLALAGLGMFCLMSTLRRREPRFAA
jgi:PEP-CTERM motif